MTRVLAIDIGAESGRVVAVTLGKAGLAYDEVHRFPNTPTYVRGTLYWDVLALWRGLTEGVGRAMAFGPTSLGVDTWAVDFALLDARGELIGAPVHYRDARTEGMMAEVFKRLSPERIFRATGIQFMPINTLYQLMSLVATNSPQLQIAETFLTIPDLLNYWLTGTKACEYTNATTTQLVHARTKVWSDEILAALELPRQLFPEIIPPGSELGSFEGLRVIAPATHDTGSAVAGVPATTRNFAYISSGTWSLVGLETEAPILSDAALAANITNEGGAGGTNRLLKNVMGLWIIQQCRERFEEAGERYSYAELVALAEQVSPLQAIVPVNDDSFLKPGDHPAQVQALCRASHQPVPANPGEITRCVLDSLALAYREVIDSLEALSERSIQVIHVVGGGARNALLCQLTANATGRLVIAGPAEATVLGNAALQLIATGELKDLAEARQLIAASETLQHFEPQDTERFEDAYRRYRRLWQRDLAA